MSRPIAAGLAGMLLVLFAVTGCTAAARTPISVHRANHPATPTPAASFPATITPAPATTVATATCQGWGFWERDSYSEAQQPVDCGPIPYATGTATLDDKGVPVAYVVAPGDSWEFIAKRFDLGTAYLTSINAVRRDPPTVVYVGDTVNLDPATITTVGDQNGVVFHLTDELPEPHVPQH